MENAFYITENNLIGNVASAMLVLKRIKEKKGSSEELSPFIKLIEFINQANNTSYKDLLYDKNFIISEGILTGFHVELQNSKIGDINLSDLVHVLSKTTTDSTSKGIDKTIKVLRQLTEILLQMKTLKQIYM